MPIALVNGNFGQPALKLDQSWVKENVDSGIINALNNKELVLFVVLAIICALFVASATLANVRQRRREIAVLRTVGWPVRLIFSLFVGEAALVGLVAGVAGALLTLLLAVLGSLNVPTLRIALIVPVAVVLAFAAALLPAWRATTIQPLEALQDPVWRSRRRQRVRTVSGLAVANMARVPGRSLLAFSTLALAVATLALILGLNVAFHGAVAGNLLGNVVIVNIRDADLITTVLVVLPWSAQARSRTCSTSAFKSAAPNWERSGQSAGQNATCSCWRCAKGSYSAAAARCSVPSSALS